MKELTLSFPEDYEILNKYINKKQVCKRLLFNIHDKKSGTITKLAPAVKSIDKLAIVPSTVDFRSFDVPVPFALVLT